MNSIAVPHLDSEVEVGGSESEGFVPVRVFAAVEAGLSSLALSAEVDAAIGVLY